VTDGPTTPDNHPTDNDGTSVTVADVIPEEAFVDSRDAMLWARAFCSRVRTGLDATDEGWLVGWFANYAAAVERHVRAEQPPVTGDPNEQAIVVHVPLSDARLNLDLVPLQTDALLVLHTPGVPAEEMPYVAASLQNLVDHLRPAARGAIVLDVEGQTIESMDPTELRKIGLRWVADDEL
jgi:hypothetical protein